MNRSGHVFVVFFLFFVIHAGCSKGGNAEKIASGLEDRLTQALSFEGGAIVNEEPPVGSSDPSAPQIKTIDAPVQFRKGADFKVVLTSDFDQPDDVDKALVHVKGASKYIVINKPLSSLESSEKWLSQKLLEDISSVMKLAGVLTDDDELGGEFILEYALQTKDGVTGVFKERSMEIPEEVAECLTGDCCNGGQWIEEGSPCVSGEDDLSCTDDLCTAEHACEAVIVEGFCAIDGSCFADGVVDLDHDCQMCDATLSPATWTFRGSEVECRSSAGECDVAEFCDGNSADCPDDTKSTESCRESAGICDVEEFCDGVNDVCPDDGYRSQGDECDDSDACTANDQCDGLGPDAANCQGETYSCNGNGDCNESDAFCSCAEGYTGDYCDECDAGYQGYPNCVPVTVKIQPGSFIMGSPDGENCPPDEPECSNPPEAEPGRADNEVQHQVTLTQEFSIMTWEVTQQEFETLLGYNPSEDSTCGDDCPVETVSWHEALLCANAKSLADDLDECFDCTGTEPDVECSLKAAYSKPQDCPGWRLPTEAEWEYAIRAGSSTALYPSDGNDGSLTLLECNLDTNLNQIGWFCGNEEEGINPSGRLEPNAWGLYDMSGNVWEWVWDSYCSEYETYGTSDPDGQECSGLNHVVRGGAWNRFAEFSRSAYRYFNPPEYKDLSLGFRLVKTESE